MPKPWAQWRGREAALLGATDTSCHKRRSVATERGMAEAQSSAAGV